MTSESANLPAAVDRAAFQAELDALRVREKAHTREGDAIAAARRRLPMVEVDASLELTGPDGPVKPHDVVRHAPDQLREIGIGQAEALRMLTSVAAEVIGLGHRKGRIAPGFDADILAVDGDPIADPDALHRIRAVYARGAAVPDAGTAQPAA